MLDLRSITNVTVCHSPQAANKVLGPRGAVSLAIFVTIGGLNSGAGRGFEPPTTGVQIHALALIAPGYSSACRVFVALASTRREWLPPLSAYQRDPFRYGRRGVRTDQSLFASSSDP